MRRPKWLSLLLIAGLLWLPAGKGIPTRDSHLTLTGSGAYAMGNCTETLGGSFDYVSYSAWSQGKSLCSSAFKAATDTKLGAVAMGLASNLVALFPVSK